MIGLRVAIGVMWICSLLLGRAVWSSTLTSGKTQPETVAASPAGRTPSVPRTRVGDPLPSQPDLYGNEIDVAVAEYELDGHGALFELHSPETAVSRLAPPSM